MKSMRRRRLSLPLLSAVTTTTVPSDGALQSVDGLPVVSMIETFWLGNNKPNTAEPNHINVFFSVSAGLRHSI